MAFGVYLAVEYAALYDVLPLTSTQLAVLYALAHRTWSPRTDGRADARVGLVSRFSIPEIAKVTGYDSKTVSRNLSRLMAPAPNPVRAIAVAFPETRRRARFYRVLVERLLDADVDPAWPDRRRVDFERVLRELWGGARSPQTPHTIPSEGIVDPLRPPTGSPAPFFSDLSPSPPGGSRTARPRKGFEPGHREVEGTAETSHWLAVQKAHPRKKAAASSVAGVIDYGRGGKS